MPHEWTFSRAFATFVRLRLPDLVHEVMVRKSYQNKLVGHVSSRPLSRRGKGPLRGMCPRGPRPPRTSESPRSSRQAIDADRRTGRRHGLGGDARRSPQAVRYKERSTVGTGELLRLNETSLVVGAVRVKGEFQGDVPSDVRYPCPDRRPVDAICHLVSTDWARDREITVFVDR